MAEVIQYEINGVTKIAHDADTFKEYLQLFGLDPERVKSMFYDEIAEEVEDSILDDYMHNRISPNCDGLLGDAFFTYQEAIRSEVNDLENDIYESLLSSSRKNNTKADIARRLDSIIKNLYDLVG